MSILPKPPMTSLGEFIDSFLFFKWRVKQTWVSALSDNQLTTGHKGVTPERAKLASPPLPKNFIFPLNNPNCFDWSEYFIPPNCQFWFFGTLSADLELKLKPWSIYKHVKYLLSRVFRHGPPVSFTIVITYYLSKWVWEWDMEPISSFAIYGLCFG